MSLNKTVSAPHFPALPARAARYIGEVTHGPRPRPSACLDCCTCPLPSACALGTQPGARHGPRLRRALAVAFGTALSATAGAQVVAPPSALGALPPGLLDQGLVMLKQAAQTLSPPQARVTVTAGAPDSRLKLAPCSAGSVSLVAGVPAWGTSRLGLRCTQGAAWNIQLPVKVQVFAPAVVAASALSSGTTLSSTHLVLAEVDWAASGPSIQGLANGQPALFTAAAALDSRELARPLAAGAPVRRQDLKSRLWFAAGTTVSVLAVGEGFSVAAEGQALSPGLEGQAVRVRTEGGRVLVGQATGERRVEVRL